MNWEEIQLLTESWDFEAKAAVGRDGKGELPKNIWETYSAFANSDGGLILLGAKERKDHSIEPVGIGDIQKLESDLWNLANSKQTVSVNLLSQSDVSRVEVGGKVLLAISVPRAGRKERPVFCKGNPLGGTFRRNFEGDYKCSREEVRRMMADADDRPRDGSVLEHFGMDDIDEESINAYRNLFRSGKPNHPFLEGDNQRLLTQLGGWGKDRQTGTEGLTLAGLLMFGKRRSILDRLPYYNLDYRELPDASIQSGTRWLDRINVDGTWPGNVFFFFQKVFRKLVADLKVPFQLDEQRLQRKDETPVHEALREALVNTLIHADYTGTTGIRVFKKPDGFEFINPGGLRVPLPLIWSGGRSDCRNPAMQVMFQMLGFGEKAGSGFPRITNAWAEQHWRLPEIEENIPLDETTLRLSVASLLSEETVAALHKQFADFSELSLNQRVILATAYELGEVDHAGFNKVVGVHSRDLTLDLQTLIRKGMLERIGSGRGCSYRVSLPVLVNSPNGKGPVVVNTPGAAEVWVNTPSADPYRRGDKMSGKMSGKTSGKILNECRENGNITIPQLSEIIGVTERTVQRNLQKLQLNGQLRRVGSKKTGYWEVVDK